MIIKMKLWLFFVASFAICNGNGCELLCAFFMIYFAACLLFPFLLSSQREKHLFGIGYCIDLYQHHWLKS